MKIKKEYLLAGITVCFWGTLAPANKLLLNSISEMELLFLSTFLATVFLLALNIVTGNIKELKNHCF